MYIFKHDDIVAAFTKFGFSTYIIYPLAACKLFGISMIWIRKKTILLNLAYAGFLITLS